MTQSEKRQAEKRQAEKRQAEKRQAESEESIWRFVPTADYRAPSPPVSQAARRRLAFLRRLWQRDKGDDEPLFTADDDLLALSDWWLSRIVPVPGWSAAAGGLDERLADWLTRRNPEQPVIVLVAPPHSGIADILTAWAEAGNRPALISPTPEQVLDDVDEWLPADFSAADAWVLPALEKLFLRHHRGLDLVRRFLNQAISGQWGRGVLCCDSWAWAYLRHVWQGQQPITLTLQPFGREQLTALFGETSGGTGSDQLLFRQADNGRYVLPPSEAHEENPEMSTFLQILAAHSRGIVGIAREVWGVSLQAEPDDTIDDETAREERSLPNQTIWVKPWNSLKHPSMPANTGQEQALLLHTLLLHNGLRPDLLELLLPLTHSQTAAALSGLREAGLVESLNGRLRVTPLGYPAVRRFLQTEGYLVDGF